MGVVPYQDLPITDEEVFVSSGSSRASVENDVLGNLESPNWDRYKKAHLWFDPENRETKAGYKLIIARMVGGRLKVIWRQVIAAVAVLNGARGGADIPAADKRRVFNHAMRYYAKMGIEPADRPEFRGSVGTERGSQMQFCPSTVKLSLIDVSEDDFPKWVQLAEEGDYPGYRNGEQPFSMTRKTFEQFVTNLHNNPSYEAGEDGIGIANVIPWDFHHASEMYPAEGVIPTIGAPAQAWTRELEIRDSEDGKAQLWGLTYFLELARGYVRNGQYQWPSIAFDLDAIDERTGKKIGALLTSIALTNMPVVKGMQRLVASKQVNAGYMYMEPADGVDEAIERLKQVLGLSAVAGIGELTGELARLRQLAESGQSIPGVDFDGIVGAMRRLFNLPVLATIDEVMGEADKMITGVVQNQVGQMATASAGALTASVAKPKREGEDMDMVKILASQLGVREADDAVKAAIGDLVALRDGIKKLLESDSDASKQLLDGAAKSVSARSKLTALVTALGVEDAEGAVNRVAELMTQAAELAKVMPELTELKAKVAKQEEEQAVVDVDAVAAAHGYDDKVKPALLMMRKNDPDGFRASYPVQAPKPNEGHLLSTIAVKQPGSKVEPIVKTSVVQSNVINLAKYPGRNRTERAMSYIKSNVSGADSWSLEQLFVQACELKKDPNVIDQLDS